MWNDRHFVFIFFVILGTEGIPTPSSDVKVDQANTNGNTGPEEQHSENILEAYWCGDPRGVQNSGFVNNPRCNSQAKVVKTVDTVYQLIHEVKRQTVTGFACSVTETRLARYCGSFDHQTVLSSYTRYDTPLSISAAQCQDWHMRLDFKDPGGKQHDLKEDAINIIGYEELGHTYIAPGSGEVSCLGQDMKWDGQVLQNMIVEVQLKITLKKETFKITGSEVIAHYDDVALRCTTEQGNCQEATATYLWNKPDPCVLAYEKDVRGTEVTSDGGDHVFMSTDASLMRLIKKNAVSICDRVVYETNYEGVYLYPAGKNPFERKVRAEDVSIVTYVNNRDDYLYNHIADILEEEMRSVLSDECSNKAQRTRVDYWLQHQDASLTTWLVGNGVFATTAGEVIYQYKCRPVKVRAVLRDRCYQALPVEILGNLGEKFKGRGSPASVVHGTTHQEANH